MLDDFQNLRGLARLNEAFSWREALFFILNSASSQIGRPVAMFSFMLQHAAWPSDILGFRLVNLGLHLFNGALVYYFLLQLGALLDWEHEQRWKIALLTTLVWLIHPIQVSTVAYVIQRMVLLAACFTLLGIIAYLHGRKLLMLGRARRAYFWMSFAVIVCGGLAALAKENGMLLLVYLVVLESVLLAPSGRRKVSRAWLFVFLYSPLLLAVSLFIYRPDWFLSGYGIREFTLYERGLTEFRVLWQYVLNIALPRPSAYGLYFDDYPVSHGLTAPVSTLFAILGIALSVALAIRMKRRAPLVSLAILWFLGGHLLESTILPLELYFEHRNYLPMLGFILAGAYYGVHHVGKIAGHGGKALVVAIFSIYLLMLAWITLNENRLWGNSIWQASVWAKERPESRRAQEHHAVALTITKNFDAAATAYGELARKDVKDGRYLLNILMLACFDESVPLPKMETIQNGLRNSQFSFGPTSNLEQLILMKEEGDCARVSTTYLHAIATSLLSNGKFESQWPHLHFFEGRIFAIDGDLNQAMSAVDLASGSNPQVEYFTYQIDWLTSAGLFDDATQYVEKARETAKGKIKTSWYYQYKLDQWSDKINLLKNSR